MATNSTAPYDVDANRRASITKAVAAVLPKGADSDELVAGLALLLHNLPKDAPSVVAIKTALQRGAQRTPAMVLRLVNVGQPVRSAAQVAEAERLCNPAMQEEHRAAQERVAKSSVLREKVLLLRCVCSAEPVPHVRFERGEENKKGAKAAMNSFKRCQTCARETQL